jgi:D-lactate dehydrogenase
MPKQEWFPLVNEAGEVMGKATRQDCHSGSKQLHPVVHLHVFNEAGELYLQKRAKTKDIQPGKWDAAVGGHIDWGETADEALRREAREELGISDFTPEFITRYVFESDVEKELVHTYRTCYKGKIKPDKEELAGGRFWSISQIKAHLSKGFFTPNFEAEFQRVFLPLISFLEEISRFIPKERIYTNEAHRLAWGTDAGFYRLIPKLVIRSEGEQEVSKLLSLASQLKIPVTFRAAGSSLSGQAISDSVLIVAGKHWEKYRIAPDATSITLQAGLVGQRVNELLKPYGRVFPPDPASLKSAMVGGIVANNASGMSCGTHANSDKVIRSARIVCIDGSILDTGDEKSRSAFASQHPDFIRRIEALRDRVRSDTALSERIRRKYSIKNVVGLNLLPFITHEDPFEIITHLMVGSEGCLAFLSEVTMATAEDYPCKASAMVYFSDIKEACRAVQAMKKLLDERNEWIVKSAELLDSKSLACVNDTTGVGLTAVLTETKAHTAEALQENIQRIRQALSAYATCMPVCFTDKESEYSRYWAIRSGVFPSVGGSRRPGTTCLIEDVAFHIEDLPEAVAAIQKLLADYGYEDACIYGHALEGNIHFILNQSFHTEEEVNRYEALMNAVKTLVIDRFDGSLKAEHGTGRNMAPFVAYEWGEAAFSIMREVKALFDPAYLLNPGVIFNDDPNCHIRHFKPLPPVHPSIDKCIECGFCEVNCLTCGFTFSSRQRIVIRREIARLKQSGEAPAYLHALQKQYAYPGEQSCAGDGLCARSCPMGIDTGELTHLVRSEQLSPSARRIGRFASRRLAGLKTALRLGLGMAHAAHTLLGSRLMSRLAKTAHRIPGLPLWTPAMPLPYHQPGQSDLAPNKLLPDGREKKYVVYFPSCINQTMGVSRQSPDKTPLVNKMISLLHKAGYEVIFPEGMERLCCGTIWESKGMEEEAGRKSAELAAALWKASKAGSYPVLCDQSPCLYRMRRSIPHLKLYEPVEFIHTFLLDRLRFTPITEPIAIHITCSMRKMGLENMVLSLAQHCATRVIIPEETGCCGFAGDKGFTCPEVNAYALRKLRPQIEKGGIQTGYSNSRTCEIGLTTHSGIPYLSLVYLVDKCTTA